MITINKFTNYIKNKKAIYALFLIICSLVFAGVAGTILVIGSYSLPTDNIRQNIAKSLKIYDIEKDRYAWAPSIISSQMDNWTDSVSISTVGYEKGKDFKQVVRNSMLNPYYVYDGVEYKSGNLRKAFSQQNPELGVSHWNYGRYWHGYVIFLRPLLSIFTISDIRVLNMVIQTILLLMLMNALFKEGGKKLAIPFGIAILIFNPISSALGMTYACLYYITLISILCALRWKLYQSQYYFLFFLWVGIITVFFDLLTYPLTALGCNLILYILITIDNLFDKMRKVIIASVSWGTGYAVMWAEKWIIGYLLTGNNIIEDAINQAKIRTSGSVSNIMGTLIINVKAYDNHIFYTLLILGVLSLLILYLSGRYKFKLNQSIVIPLLLVAVYPFVWLIVMKNHCFIHHWMTHKILMIFILALVYTIIYSMEENVAEKQVNIFNYKMWRSDFTICLHRLFPIIISAIILYIITIFWPIKSRVDIYAKYTEEPIFTVKIDESDEPIKEASWMLTGGNRGIVGQKNGYSAIYVISVSKDVDINIDLRGPDERDAIGKRVEKWVKYTDFRVNGEKILSEPVEVWHDKPFNYVLKAEKGKLYKISFKWRKK